AGGRATRKRPGGRRAAARGRGLASPRRRAARGLGAGPAAAGARGARPRRRRPPRPAARRRDGGDRSGQCRAAPPARAALLAVAGAVLPGRGRPPGRLRPGKLAGLFRWGGARLPPPVALTGRRPFAVKWGGGGVRKV